MQTFAHTNLSRSPQVGIAREPTPRIEDHALIGDLHTAALVTTDGSVDWLCLPAFDSDACFAALVGKPSNGRWKLAPTVPVKAVQRRYRNDTLILETDFVTDSGTVRVVDFMPPLHGRESSQVCRVIRCIEGSVPMRSEVSPRLAFGRAVPRVVPVDGATKMFAGPDALYLRGGPPNGAPALITDFALSKGEEVSYSLAYGRSYEEPPHLANVAEAERETEAFWTEWSSGLHVPELYRDLVIRSLITLKACIYEPTGGMVAPPRHHYPRPPAGCATGTTASVGCATGRSPCAR